jgi:hypothetical protein
VVPDRAHHVAPADYADQTAAVHDGVAAVLIVDEPLGEVENGVVRVDGDRVRAHEVANQAARLSMVTGIQGDTEAVALGQHADQAPVLVQHRRTGYVTADQHLRSTQNLHVRVQCHDLCHHVVLY